MRIQRSHYIPYSRTRRFIKPEGLGIRSRLVLELKLKFKLKLNVKLDVKLDVVKLEPLSPP